jgi:hypothetical protein
VTTDVGGIDCTAVSGACSASVPSGTSVTFTAQPSAGVSEPAATFTAWGGTAGCTGSALTCATPVTANSTVTAAFSSVHARLAVTIDGTSTGTGSVTSSPAGIDCGATCSATFTDPTFVTLTASPDSDSLTAEWGGACQGQPATSACKVPVTDGDVGVTIRFKTKNSTLVVIRGGTGSGTVTSGDSGIDCGATCSATYTDGATVTLTAQASPGSKLVGWAGACTSITGNVCEVDVASGSMTVSAVFDLKTSGGSDEADTQVDAELISVRQLRSATGRRLVRVELGVDETLSAVVRLTRGDKTIALRRVATLRDGDRFVKITIPKSAAKGSASLVIELHDQAGHDLTITRTVKLPKP